MYSFEMADDEVIVFEGNVICREFKGQLKLTLTSQKMVLEKTKGLLKKELEIVSVLKLEDIKVYNNEVQVEQKKDVVTVQATSMNYSLIFGGTIEAKKFAGKMIDVSTGTTKSQRGSGKIKGALDLVDDTLDIDSRGAVKGLLQNGLKGTLINGLGKKKEKDE